MKLNQSIKLNTSHNERPQNIGCGLVPIAIGSEIHIFLASGFHFHIHNQMDAGGPAKSLVPHIGVGADMAQKAIEMWITPFDNPQRWRVIHNSTAQKQQTIK